MGFFIAYKSHLWEDHPMNKIYDSIKNRMEARGMSALSLAAASGVGKSTIYRIISNKNVSITMESLEKIMIALDMKLVLSPAEKSNKQQ